MDLASSDSEFRRGEGGGAAAASLPDIGEVVKRLRLQRNMSIAEVADASGVSRSFLSMIERGNSDISLGTLAKIAAVFGHDIGTLLGYGSNVSRPTYLASYDRTMMDRGKGVTYEILRLPWELELTVMSFAPHSGFSEAFAHDGFDVVLVHAGELVLSIGNDEYRLPEGACIHYSAVYAHRLRNDGRRYAHALGLTTGHLTPVARQRV